MATITGTAPLLISGNKSDAYMSLFIDSFVEETLPLFLFANYDTRTLFIQCGYSSSADLPLFMNSVETFNSIPLYIVSGESSGLNNAIPITLKQTTHPTGDIRLYIAGQTGEPINNELNLSLQQGASEGGKGYLRLSIEGKQITLYPDNRRSSNGFIPTFDTITLMMNREIDSTSALFDMYISGVAGVSFLSLNEDIPLSLKAIEGTTNSSIPLYIIGPNPLTASTDVFISGG